MIPLKRSESSPARGSEEGEAPSSLLGSGSSRELYDEGAVSYQGAAEAPSDSAAADYGRGSRSRGAPNVALGSDGRVHGSGPGRWPDGSRLFVKWVHEAERDEITRRFSRHGRLAKPLEFIQRIEACFVQFNDEVEARRAMQAEEGALVAGRRIKVEVAIEDRDAARKVKDVNKPPPGHVHPTRGPPPDARYGGPPAPPSSFGGYAGYGPGAPEPPSGSRRDRGDRDWRRDRDRDRDRDHRDHRDRRGPEPLLSLPSHAPPPPFLPPGVGGGGGGYGRGGEPLVASPPGGYGYPPGYAPGMPPVGMNMSLVPMASSPPLLGPTPSHLMPMPSHLAPPPAAAATTPAPLSSGGPVPWYLQTPPEDGFVCRVFLPDAQLYAYAADVVRRLTEGGVPAAAELAEGARFSDILARSRAKGARYVVTVDHLGAPHEQVMVSMLVPNSSGKEMSERGAWKTLTVEPRG